MTLPREDVEKRWFTALYAGDIAAVREMLGQVPLETTDKHGRNALGALVPDIVYAGGGLDTRQELAELLIEAGADVNLREPAYMSLASVAFGRTGEQTEGYNALQFYDFLLAHGFQDRIDDTPAHVPDVPSLHRRLDGYPLARQRDLARYVFAQAVERWETWVGFGKAPPTIACPGLDAVPLDLTLPRQALKAYDARDLAGCRALVRQLTPAAQRAAHHRCELPFKHTLTAGWCLLRLFEPDGVRPDPCAALALALAAVRGEHSLDDLLDRFNELPSPVQDATPLASWRLRSSTSNELLTWFFYTTALALGLVVAFAPLTCVLDNSWAAGLIITWGTCVTFVAMPLAYVATLRRPLGDPGELRLYADRVELPLGSWWRDAALHTEAICFEGMAGSNVYVGSDVVSTMGIARVATRSLVQTTLLGLRRDQTEVVIYADGDIGPALRSARVRLVPELESFWPRARRLRMWPADLVAVVEAL